MKSRPFLTSARAPRSLLFVILALFPAWVWAVCTCGFGDGRLTLTSINVNGNLGDWAPVHADLDNNVCDGAGPSDRDAPVQSTGRDLTHFAFTYDASNLYLFTERFGASSNTQTFVYYADVDNDGLMETGEPVIGVTWQGSNRRINVYVFTYVSQAPGGDPMVDMNGFADGYTLPGSFANVPSTGNPTRSGRWGSSSGLQMEFFVTWAELGVAPGTPFTFHVSSTNASLGASSFTAQVDDNLSGCGGGLGSTAQPGVTFTPDRALNAIAGQAVTAAHTLTNDGNINDSFDIATTTGGDFTVSATYYEDTDGSGTLTAADTLLTDTNADGLPNTAVLSPGQSITLLAVYDIPPTAGEAEVATVTSTARSDFQPLATDSVTDAITIIPQPRLVASKTVETISDPVNLTVNAKSIPGSVVEYTIAIENQGAGVVDANSFVVFDPIPENSCMIVGDIAGPGSGPVIFVDGSPASTLSYSYVSLASTTDDVAFSNDGGITFTYTPIPDTSGCDASVTHVQISPTGQFAADTGSGSPSATFVIRVRIE